MLPPNISYPQDVNLLNKARENLEGMIDRLCHDYNYYKPRMFREKVRKDYLNFARCKKCTAKKMRKAIKQQLQYLCRDREYINAFLEAGVELTPKQAARLKVIDEVCKQQLYMYENKVHSVPKRIVSISQPYIRPIVREKLMRRWCLEPRRI